MGQALPRPFASNRLRGACRRFKASPTLEPAWRPSRRAPYDGAGAPPPWAPEAAVTLPRRQRGAAPRPCYSTAILLPAALSRCLCGGNEHRRRRSHFRLRRRPRGATYVRRDLGPRSHFEEDGTRFQSPFELRVRGQEHFPVRLEGGQGEAVREGERGVLQLPLSSRDHGIFVGRNR